MRGLAGIGHQRRRHIRRQGALAAGGLAHREFEIFRLLAAGRTVEQIAARLFLSAKTVANYQTLIRQKTGLASVLDMYRHAETHRLLDGTE